MTNFIPIFPLDIVVYPGEALNLHVFEPRYKQLAQECLKENKKFGIPVVLDGRIQEFGILMEVTELVKEYDNGEMDIKTKGVDIFRILEVIKDVPDKLYSGAIVSYPENEMEPGETSVAKLILDEVRRMYSLMDAEAKFRLKNEGARSYDIAHFVGLNKEQEYELLGLFKEIQRMEYLRRHLNAMMPVILELENMKARISRNGHFRNLSLDDLNP